MAKLTKRVVDALKPDPARDIFVWDEALKGFGLRMKPSGAASYIVQYRTRQGQTRRLAFAKVGTLAPEEARTEARLLLAEAQKGSDPSAQRHAEREALTVEHLCSQYLEAARKGLVCVRSGKAKRPSTVAIDEGRVSRHIVPLIGSKVANTLVSTDVQRMADAIAAGKTAAIIKTKARGVARVTGGQVAAKRVVGLLGGIWSWAAKRGLVGGPNPARGLDLRADKPKDRTLTTGELASLGDAMRNHAERWPLACGALRLIALTALRRGEAYGLRWREIDSDGSCLRLIDSKTGRSTRPIGEAALKHLRSLPKLHDEYVFPGRGGDGGADLKKQVAAMFDAAGLKDARGHDLRRSFASIAAELGYSDATIGELLGHARRGVTAVHYIRRPDAALIAAADRVAERIAAAMDGGRGAEVVSLPKVRRR
ncbi:MAG TPA: tyrosine-type recombinase/integrase [Methylocella sp.]|jgi:integrase